MWQTAARPPKGQQSGSPSPHQQILRGLCCCNARVRNSWLRGLGEPPGSNKATPPDAPAARKTSKKKKRKKNQTPPKTAKPALSSRKTREGQALVDGRFAPARDLARSAGAHVTERAAGRVPACAPGASGGRGTRASPLPARPAARGHPRAAPTGTQREPSGFPW